MPRSASRDLADRYVDPATGRRRRYYRARNRPERWKMLLSAAALAAVVGWAAASFLSPALDSQVSHGPVIQAHAAFETNCGACHAAGVAAGVFDARTRWHAFDGTCQTCHAAPAHRATVLPGDAGVNDCGSCHHDHGGKTFSLVKLSDDHCVRCHADINANTLGGSRSPNITSFAAGHPEFKSLAKADDRHLKFSHSQHMTPGIVLKEGSPSAWTREKLAALSPGAEGKYTEAKGLIQLDCAACHTLETDPASRAAGKYFQPIRYQQHCAACHPTRVPPTVTPWGAVTTAIDVPHGLQPEALTPVLEAAYAARVLDLNRTVRGDLDGRAEGSAQPVAGLKAAAEKLAKGMTDAVVTAGCMKCHDRTPNAIIKPAIPTVVLTAARFDHTAHRATACADCHPNTASEVKDGLTVVKKPEVTIERIRGVESCRECHKPKDATGGGVRHGCTDCHGFHNLDHPLQGRGAAAFFPKSTVEEFLKGK